MINHILRRIDILRNPSYNRFLYIIKTDRQLISEVGLYSIFMPSIVRSDGTTHTVTTCILPSELNEKARALGINYSETLREALADKISATEDTLA